MNTMNENHELMAVGTSMKDSMAYDPQEMNCRGPRFASVKAMAPFFPQVDSSRPKSWYSRQDVILAAASITAAAVFLINTISTIVISQKYSNSDLYVGNCETASQISSGLHVMINVLASLLLGASNYCMQLLTAPTRSDVDKAHAKRIWLDIGVPSLRNLKYMAKKRRVAWWLLGLSSVPLHFLYNSGIYNSQPHNAINFLVVKPDFLNDGPVSTRTATTVAMSRRNVTLESLPQGPPYKIETLPIDSNWGQGNGQWTFNISNFCSDDSCTDYRQKVMNNSFSKNLTKSQCLDAYLTSSGNRSDVLLISTEDILAPNTTFSSNNTLLFAAESYLSTPGFYWECGSTNTFDCRTRSNLLKNPTLIENWNVIGYKIDYCLSSERSLDEACVVKYSLPIMIIVCCANWCKCICIIYTLIIAHQKQDDETLSTIGDAIVSFLAAPDSTTKRMCLISGPTDKNDAKFPLRGIWKWRPIQLKKVRPVPKKDESSPWDHLEPRVWTRCRLRMSDSASHRRWRCTIASCVILAFLGAGLLAWELNTIGDNAGSAGIFTGLGFGEANQYAQGRVGLANKPYYVQLYFDIMFANAWQFAASMVYVQYNSLLTCMLANREWNRYATEKKPIRVSTPVGLQRSSYYISMPWRYGVPLMAATSFIQWSLSQSMFVVLQDTEGPTQEFDGASELGAMSVGFSVWPTIVSILLGLILMIVLILYGRKPYPGHIPIGATCSAVISAACHPKSGDEECFKFPVQWGAVSHPSSWSVQISKDQDTSNGDNGGFKPPSHDQEKIIVETMKSDDEVVIQSENPLQLEAGPKTNIVRSRSAQEAAQDTPGHCCFSTARDLEPPEEGGTYA
ncbi:hypothetical protein BT63DRAFT_449888 [Microthyrium microscopicum]|uniref:DUF6536 domain-containing protein n=1 Tax=Microthyrium microscopicum TaxID=703497 RepID=A0A6A6URF9_9PEZI|nr:hypothetical protein BT63DRAFT_449888 [Microthyrium microscopicum]